jgi:methylmalonyl-CoA/ethylmalonyl-CoA epimerase
MASPFRRLHHIGFAVRDMERAVRYFESIGIGPWREVPASAFEGLPLLEVPNPEAFAGMKYRVCDLENVQLQLCEPPRLDSPQRDFLFERGEGVFALGFEATWDEASAAASELGLDVLQRGRRPDGTGFVDFDTLDDLGVVLGTRQGTPT